MRNTVIAVLRRSHVLWAGALYFVVGYALAKPEPVSLVSYYDCPGDSGPRYSRPGAPAKSFLISSDWCPTPEQERAFRKQALEEPARAQQVAGAFLFLILGWVVPVFLRTRVRIRGRLGVLKTGFLGAAFVMAVLIALNVAGSRRTGPDWKLLPPPGRWSAAKEIIELSVVLGSTTSGLLAFKFLLERGQASTPPGDPALLT